VRSTCWWGPFALP